MRAHKSKVAQVAAELESLRAAHGRAMQLDAASAAAVARAQRRVDFDAISAAAANRLKIMEKIVSGIEAAAKGYVQFLDATDAIAVSTVGVLPYGVDWRHVDTLIDGMPFPAGLDVLFAGEMFRHAGKSAGGQPAVLPGAKAPTVQMQDRPAAIEPAIEAVRRTNTWLLSAIKDRFDALDRADPAESEKDTQ
jgi:hypothetical protein